jgi:hypothetical protein
MTLESRQIIELAPRKEGGPSGAKKRVHGEFPDKRRAQLQDKDIGYARGGGVLVQLK